MTPLEDPIPALLRDIDARTLEEPASIAIEEDGRFLSYAALSAASETLAARLAAEVAPGGLAGYVGLVGVDCLVCFLATQKAGVGMVRLDPRHPQAALADIVADAEVDVLVAGADYESAADRLGCRETISPPPDPPVRSPLVEAARRAVSPTAPSHVAYTSGSTGRPKGVENSRALIGVATGRSDGVIQTRATDRFGLAGHFWTLQFFNALTAGASLHAFDFPGRGPLEMARWMVDRGVTVLCTYTALFRQLAETGISLPALRHLQLVGEPLTPEDLERLDAITSTGTELVNNYGSSEFPYIACWRRRHGEPIPTAIPIGTAVAPEELRLLTADGRSAVEGEPGEIVVASPLAPPGYRNDPERSAAVFPPDPERPGRRLYRTGDLARIGLDGLLHPLGRKDEQLKIRGYALRPTDVERVLAAHPKVASAAVFGWRAPEGHTRLVCRYEPSEAGPADEAELRKWMRARLPDYMTPSRFAPCEALPRTETGKIRRSALEPPEAPARDEKAAPRSPTERLVAELFRTSLGHDAFNTHDDFFDVGGDSLQAMSLLLAIASATGVTLPFESFLLEGASIEAIAERVDAATAGGRPAGLQVLKRAEKGRRLYVVPVVAGHLSDYLPLAHALPDGFELVGLQPRGLDGREAPDDNMEALAAHAADLLLADRPDGPWNIIGYSFGAALGFEILRALQASAPNRARAALIDPSGASSFTHLPVPEARVLEPLRSGRPRRALRELVRLAEGPGERAAASSTSALRAAHERALKHHRFRAFDGPPILALFAGAGPEARAAARTWRALAGPRLVAETIAGDHLTTMREPHVWPLAQRLARWFGEEEERLASPDRPAADGR